MCGWGPKGPARGRWFRSPCVGVLVPRVSEVMHVAYPVVGSIEVKGVAIHASHSLVCYSGLYVCVHCGYMAADHVVRLKSVCCKLLSPKRKTCLKMILRGRLPYGYKEWPRVHVPCPLSVELG